MQIVFINPSNWITGAPSRQVCTVGSVAAAERSVRPGSAPTEVLIKPTELWNIEQ